MNFLELSLILVVCSTTSLFAGIFIGFTLGKFRMHQEIEAKDRQPETPPGKKPRPIHK